MKIVFFSSDNNIHSGAFRAEINLIQDLQKNGHDVTLVLPYRWKGNKLAKNLNIRTKTILSTPWVCNKNKNIFSVLAHICEAPINWIASLRTKTLLKHNHFDLAVVNTLWNGIGGTQSIKLNIPTVWHLREILETGQNKSFYNKNKSFSIINKSTACIAVSNCVKEYYQNNINPQLITTIYDGINVQNFYKEDKRLFKDKTTHILMLGIVKKPKGQHIGLKALNLLKDYDFDVKIVGQCSNSYKNKLLRLVPNIKDRVEFVKATSSPQEYYNWADIFLMNSIGEAFGLVTAEAMASGLSIIAAKCDGNIEIVGDEKNGYFYEPLNYIDLSNKIKNVLTHKEEAQIKACAGQKNAVNKFDKKLNSEAILKEYLKCIANR